MSAGICGKRSKTAVKNVPESYFICTNDAGHADDHTACDGHGHVLARWKSPASLIEVRDAQGRVVRV